MESKNENAYSYSLQRDVCKMYIARGLDCWDHEMDLFFFLLHVDVSWTVGYYL